MAVINEVILWCIRGCLKSKVYTRIFGRVPLFSSGKDDTMEDLMKIETSVNEEMGIGRARSVKCHMGIQKGDYNRKSKQRKRGPSSVFQL